MRQDLLSSTNVPKRSLHVYYGPHRVRRWNRLHRHQRGSCKLWRLRHGMHRESGLLGRKVRNLVRSVTHGMHRGLRGFDERYLALRLLYYGVLVREWSDL